MGYICVVPQFVENSKKLNSSEVLSDKATFDTITKTENYLPCFHDAAFVQQQLYVSLIIWASFVVFSILWVVASNQQNRTLKNDEVGFSLALRQWARKDRIAIIINRPLQMFSSLGIFVILVNRCNYLSVDVAEYYIGLVLYLAAFVDTLVRFCAAKQKISYAFSPYTILDIFSLASYFCVGFAPSLMINGKEARTWLDFSIMRSIFIYRSFMEMDSHFDTSTRGIMLFRQAVRCFLLLAWAASVMFFVEMTGELDSFFDNGFAHLYSCSNGTAETTSRRHGFTGDVARDNLEVERWDVWLGNVVHDTLGTVGYGDNAAHYLPSRLLVMVFILAGIILFSMEIQNLVNLYQLRKIGNPPYKPKSRTTQHVVIMGNPTYPQYYVCGSPLVYQELQRAGAKSAHSVLVLAKKSKNGATRTDGAGPMEATLMDADAIFTTMLVDLKMNPSRMFTLTELTDESNSKLLNKRFVIEPAHEQHDDGGGSIDKLHSMWDIALSASSGVHNGSNASSTPSIYSMPLYMSGRLMHPQFCENLLVQVTSPYSTRRSFNAKRNASRTTIRASTAFCANSSAGRGPPASSALSRCREITTYASKSIPCRTS
ncbi:hypothetical protein DYB32_000191 [Aphanomyces invadans]|uniref:Potassium channel domain-containing protein n=1 Tax=Aphanomyces invadans TaxID=157072 RepID=A0A3R7AGG4_9STRA|nr:hypothetical protein DYB32_000191 [Aphanomyces invadans]